MKTTLSTFAMLATLATPAFADDAPDAPAPDAPIEEAPQPHPAPAPAPQSSPSDVPLRPFANASVTELVAIAPAPARTYRGAVSVQLATLDATGMAIQAEQVSKTRKKVSVVIAVGARSAAQGEFASRTLGAGVEVRRWLRRPNPMTGWYVGARTDLARTSIQDQMEDREIGTLTTWTAGVSTGYRWVFFHKVELTPSLGMAMVVEGGMAGKSPTTVRGAAIAGLTAGWIY
jgi:Protein of unknown function (DUF3575)